MQPNPTIRFSFHKLAIGDKFHTGKSKGMGGNSHIVSWEVWKKTSKSEAVVVEQHGNFHNSLNKRRSFTAQEQAFTNVAP